MKLRCVRFLGLWLLCIVPIWAQGGKPGDSKPSVVFVCEHGSAKSVIAAAEFKRMAQERGLDLIILSRGANPDTEIPKLVRDGLKADGLEAGVVTPTRVSKKDLMGATKIVSFGPDLAPWVPDGASVLDWNATPSVSQDYHAARDYIRKRLQLLLKEFKN